jgi:hypothetical protein
MNTMLRSLSLLPINTLNALETDMNELWGKEFDLLSTGGKYENHYTSFYGTTS